MSYQKELKKFYGREKMKSRTHYSLINSSVSSIIYFLRLILGFIVRTFFIKYLGAKYLGLNGLFTNILSFLSLAELGFGATMVYELYEPLAKNDKKKICAYMLLYKRVYSIIGVVIGILGICLIPFLPFIIKNENQIPNVNLFYVLFLSNSVISYFFTYKRSILIADQKNYRVLINDFAFYFLSSILQICVLVFFQNFTFYLLIQILTTLLSNISISKIADSEYPIIKKKTNYIIPKKDVSKLKKNVVGNISGQIGGVVVLGSDNILISMFVNLASVGIYSNYTLLTNSVKTLMQQATNSITASIGNLVIDQDINKHYTIFKQYLFLNTSLNYFCVTILFALINPFIIIWVGKDYLLSENTVLLLMIYLGLLIYQNAVRNFCSAYGLFWEQKMVPIYEAITNLTFSLIFLIYFHLGIDGVLLGTICSTLTVDVWYEPYILFKKGMHKSLKEYSLKTLISYLKILIGLLVVHFARNIVPVNNIVTFIVDSLFTFIYIIISYLILFGYERDFKIIVNRLLKIND